MKKLLTLLLAIGFVFGMVACGGSTATEETATEETATEEETEAHEVEEVAPMVEEAPTDSTSMEEETEDAATE